ncbi:MAG TPA: EI24 domain-containing protein [Anaeromyxobacteraceae bacterium]|nr:EI24 domain-containing protein [Anaeromyxobacteraceae bacterium]
MNAARDGSGGSRAAAIPAGPLARLAAGAALPLRGAAYLAAHRELWRHALLPVALTVAGLVAGLVAAVPLAGTILSALWAEPEGLLAAAWWLARIALAVVLVFLAAVALPATLSAPFSDALSARVEALELGARGGGGWGRAAAEAWSGTIHTAVRLAVLLLGHAVLLPLLVVPIAYPVLAFLWTARWAAFEYLDLPMARNLHRWREVRAALRSVRPLGTGFGAVLAALFLVPFANLLVVPIGAAAGTLLYCDLVRTGGIVRGRGGSGGAERDRGPLPG